MKRFNMVLAALLLAVVAPVAWAQHSGHGGTSSGEGFGNTGNDKAMRDFNRARLLQATADQRAAIASCIQASDTAHRVADEMAGTSTHPRSDAYVIPDPQEQLQTALADMAAAHQHFRHALSQVQEKELRKSLDKLDRLQAELASRMANVNRDLSATKPDPRRLSSDTRKLKEVVEKWHSEHRKIANEIGIGG
jgi:chromosome segregation ATPase